MRRLGSLPIQVRITLGSLLVAAFVLAGVAMLLHLQIRSTTEASEETLARSDLTPFASDLQNNPGEPLDAPAAGILVAVRTESDGFLVNSLPAELQRNLSDRDLTDREFVKAEQGDRNGEAPTRRVTSGGSTYVVVEQHLTLSSGEASLWAARSTASGDLTVDALDRSLIMSLLIAFFSFGAAAWILSNLALRPVRRMAESALLLADDDSTGDLPVSRAGDELAVLAETLNAFIRRLRASAEHERRMVSDASHELRTPLAALTARLELAHRSFGDAPALQQEIIAAQGSVRRLTDLATTLLELSRLAQPSTDFATPSTGGMLVAELLDAVDRARIGAGGAAVEVDFDLDGVTDQGASYALSPTSFGRIADNLLTNAIAFSPSGGRVIATLLQRHDGSLELAVTDDGPGVPDSFVPVAFDRFTRADESRRRIRGGSGLGLALVLGLVETAGGTAQLANRSTGGAIATVRVPKM